LLVGVVLLGMANPADFLNIEESGDDNDSDDSDDERNVMFFAAALDDGNFLQTQDDEADEGAGMPLTGEEVDEDDDVDEDIEDEEDDDDDDGLDLNNENMRLFAHWLRHGTDEQQEHTLQYLLHVFAHSNPTDTWLHTLPGLQYIISTKPNLRLLALSCLTHLSRHQNITEQLLLGRSGLVGVLRDVVKNVRGLDRTVTLAVLIHLSIPLFNKVGTSQRRGCGTFSHFFVRLIIVGVGQPRSTGRAARSHE
jgi:hypothetical protein